MNMMAQHFIQLTIHFPFSFEVHYGLCADINVNVLIPGESGPGQHETEHQSSGRNYGQDQTL